MGKSRSDLEASEAFGEALREAILRQEEAIAGFIGAAAQHLERLAVRGAGDGCAAQTPEPAALAGVVGQAALALSEAARMAEALTELQRQTLLLVRTLGAGQLQAKPESSAGEARTVRSSPPDKAPPAWFAPAPGKSRQAHV